ncbi:MAG: phospholipase [Bacteroidota bacterium]
MIGEYQKKVLRTAHYYTLGEIHTETRYFVLACHGYAQLAKHFIRRFDILMNDDTFILAPEGLSRFYWKGLTGEVAASWMTKEDRLDEIEDYCNYLQSLYEQYIPQLPEKVRIILFGFSQGCATQCRWIMEKMPHFHDLILWAGAVPEDLDYRPKKHYFKDKNLHWVYGTEDSFLTPKRILMHQELLKVNELDFEIHTFEGKHEVERSVLKELYQNMIDG